MSKIGTADIKGIMLGSTEIVKAYLGSDIVYQNAVPAPEGYEWCEFIENTSTAYIDTGIKPNGDTVAIADINVSEAYNYLYGARNGTSVACYLVSNAGTRPTFRYNTGQGQGLITNPLIGRHKVETRKNVLLMDGVQILSRTKATFSTNNTLYIYAYNGGSIVGNNYSKYKLYSFFIDNGDDSRDYKPIKRLSDNKYGLWDKVHQTFNVSPNGVNFAGG